MDVENVIVNGVELSQPAEICEAFRIYFSSTFRKDEGKDPKLNYSTISRMQHFTISAEDVHRQLINLNPRKSEGADEIHPRILTSLAGYLAAPLAKFSTTRSRPALFRWSGNRQLFVQSIRKVASAMLQTTGLFA